MKRFFPVILCCMSAAVSSSLSGCTAAVPYAISAAQVVAAGTSATQQYSGPLPQQGVSPPQTVQADDSKERAEAALPYQLIKEEKYDEALPLLRDRADQNDSKAQGQIGMLYYEGKGVPQDYSKAVEWILKSAEGGYPASQYMLAWFYYKGIGVVQDYTKTVVWAQKSSDQGDVNASNLLGIVHRLGRGVTKNYTKALEFFNEADRYGNVDAPVHIASMYKNGEGVSKDYRQAIDWYSKAAEKGNNLGWIQLAYLYATCKDPQYIDGKKAVAYALKGTEKEPKSFESWAALAAAYARDNQFERAIETATQSDVLLQADTKIDQTEKQAAILKAQSRLAVYTESKAYTETHEAEDL
jgi:TPR repeat protein